MMVRWSGEVQVNVNGMSNLNLSLTLVDVKLVPSTSEQTYLKLSELVAFIHSIPHSLAKLQHFNIY